MKPNPHTIRSHVQVEMPSRCRLDVATLLIVWVCTACVMSYSSQHCGFCLCPNSEATPAVANIHMPWQNSQNNNHMPWQNSQNNIHMPWQNSQNNIHMPWQNSQTCVNSLTAIAPELSLVPQLQHGFHSAADPISCSTTIQTANVRV